MKPKPDPIAEKTARLRALRLARDATLPQQQSSEPGRLWKLDDKLTFGKHSGRTITDVIDSDREYLVWAVENIPDFVLDDAAEAELQSSTDPRRPPRAWESPRY